MCDTIRRNLNKKIPIESQIELFKMDSECIIYITTV